MWNNNHNNSIEMVLLFSLDESNNYTDIFGVVSVLIVSIIERMSIHNMVLSIVSAVYLLVKMTFLLFCSNIRQYVYVTAKLMISIPNCFCNNKEWSLSLTAYNYNTDNDIWNTDTHLKENRRRLLYHTIQ